ncbi:MAG: hypothetical protein QF384_01530 [Alphaproteobacteria bacterium]|nr:hypothetical protein [Alphaproteobacteria bacterium]
MTYGDWYKQSITALASEFLRAMTAHLSRYKTSRGTKPFNPVDRRRYRYVKPRRYPLTGKTNFLNSANKMLSKIPEDSDGLRRLATLTSFNLESKFDQIGSPKYDSIKSF